jgi:hypothetical protein
VVIVSSNGVRAGAGIKINRAPYAGQKHLTDRFDSTPECPTLVVGRVGPGDVGVGVGSWVEIRQVICAGDEYFDVKALSEFLRSLPGKALISEREVLVGIQNGYDPRS